MQTLTSKIFPKIAWGGPKAPSWTPNQNRRPSTIDPSPNLEQAAKAVALRLTNAYFIGMISLLGRSTAKQSRLKGSEGVCNPRFRRNQGRF